MVMQLWGHLVNILEDMLTYMKHNGLFPMVIFTNFFIFAKHFQSPRMMQYFDVIF